MEREEEGVRSSEDVDWQVVRNPRRRKENSQWFNCRANEEDKILDSEGSRDGNVSSFYITRFLNNFGVKELWLVSRTMGIFER